MILAHDDGYPHHRLIAGLYFCGRYPYFISVRLVPSCLAIQRFTSIRLRDALVGVDLSGEGLKCAVAALQSLVHAQAVL